jgi:cytochrome c oxidase assembly protein Cox11
MLYSYAICRHDGYFQTNEPISKRSSSTKLKADWKFQPQAYIEHFKDWNFRPTQRSVEMERFEIGSS